MRISFNFERMFPDTVFSARGEKKSAELDDSGGFFSKVART